MPKEYKGFTEEEKKQIIDEYIYNITGLNKGLPKDKQLELDINNLERRLNDPNEIKVYRLSQELNEKVNKMEQEYGRLEEAYGKNKKPFLARTFSYLLKPGDTEEERTYNDKLYKEYLENPYKVFQDTVKNTMSINPSRYFEAVQKDDIAGELEFLSENLSQMKMGFALASDIGNNMDKINIHGEHDGGIMLSDEFKKIYSFPYQNAFLLGGAAKKIDITSTHEYFTFPPVDKFIDDMDGTKVHPDLVVKYSRMVAYGSDGKVIKALQNHPEVEIGENFFLNYKITKVVDGVEKELDISKALEIDEGVKFTRRSPEEVNTLLNPVDKDYLKVLDGEITQEEYDDIELKKYLDEVEDFVSNPSKYHKEKEPDFKKPLTNKEKEDLEASYTEAVEAYNKVLPIDKKLTLDLEGLRNKMNDPKQVEIYRRSKFLKEKIEKQEALYQKFKAQMKITDNKYPLARNMHNMMRIDNSNESKEFNQRFIKLYTKYPNEISQAVLKGIYKTNSALYNDIFKDDYEKCKSYCDNYEHVLIAFNAKNIQTALGNQDSGLVEEIKNSNLSRFIQLQQDLGISFEHPELIFEMPEMTLEQAVICNSSTKVKEGYDKDYALLANARILTSDAEQTKKILNSLKEKGILDEKEPLLSFKAIETKDGKEKEISLIDAIGKNDPSIKIVRRSEEEKERMLKFTNGTKRREEILKIKNGNIEYTKQFTDDINTLDKYKATIESLNKVNDLLLKPDYSATSIDAFRQERESAINEASADITNKETLETKDYNINAVDVIEINSYNYTEPKVGKTPEETAQNKADFEKLKEVELTYTKETKDAIKEIFKKFEEFGYNENGNIVKEEGTKAYGLKKYLEAINNLQKEVKELGPKLEDYVKTSADVREANSIRLQDELAGKEKTQNTKEEIDVASKRKAYLESAERVDQLSKEVLEQDSHVRELLDIVHQHFPADKSDLYPGNVDVARTTGFPPYIREDFAGVSQLNGLYAIYNFYLAYASQMEEKPTIDEFIDKPLHYLKDYYQNYVATSKDAEKSILGPDGNGLSGADAISELIRIAPDIPTKSNSIANARIGEALALLDKTNLAKNLGVKDAFYKAVAEPAEQQVLDRAKIYLKDEYLKLDKFLLVDEPQTDLKLFDHGFYKAESLSFVNYGGFDEFTYLLEKGQSVEEFANKLDNQLLSLLNSGDKGINYSKMINLCQKAALKFMLITQADPELEGSKKLISLITDGKSYATKLALAEKEKGLYQDIKEYELKKIKDNNPFKETWEKRETILSDPKYSNVPRGVTFEYDRLFKMFDGGEVSKLDQERGNIYVTAQLHKTQDDLDDLEIEGIISKRATNQSKIAYLYERDMYVMKNFENDFNELSEADRDTIYTNYVLHEKRKKDTYVVRNFMIKTGLTDHTKLTPHNRENIRKLNEQIASEKAEREAQAREAQKAQKEIIKEKITADLKLMDDAGHKDISRNDFSKKFADILDKATAKVDESKTHYQQQLQKESILDASDKLAQVVNYSMSILPQEVKERLLDRLDQNQKDELVTGLKEKLAELAKSRIENPQFKKEAYNKIIDEKTSLEEAQARVSSLLTPEEKASGKYELYNQIDAEVVKKTGFVVMNGVLNSLSDREIQLLDHQMNQVQNTLDINNKVPVKHTRDVAIGDLKSFVLEAVTNPEIGLDISIHGANELTEKLNQVNDLMINGAGDYGNKLDKWNGYREKAMELDLFDHQMKMIQDKKLPFVKRISAHSFDITYMPNDNSEKSIITDAQNPARIAIVQEENREKFEKLKESEVTISNKTKENIKYVFKLMEEYGYTNDGLIGEQGDKVYGTKAYVERLNELKDMLQDAQSNGLTPEKEFEIINKHIREVAIKKASAEAEKDVRAQAVKEVTEISKKEKLSPQDGLKLENEKVTPEAIHKRAIELAEKYVPELTDEELAEANRKADEELATYQRKEMTNEQKLAALKKTDEVLAEKTHIDHLLSVIHERFPVNGDHPLYPGNVDVTRMGGMPMEWRKDAAGISTLNGLYATINFIKANNLDIDTFLDHPVKCMNEFYDKEIYPKLDPRETLKGKTGIDALMNIMTAPKHLVDESIPIGMPRVIETMIKAEPDPAYLDNNLTASTVFAAIGNNIGAAERNDFNASLGKCIDRFFYVKGEVDTSILPFPTYDAKACKLIYSDYFDEVEYIRNDERTLSEFKADLDKNIVAALQKNLEGCGKDDFRMEDFGPAQITRAALNATRKYLLIVGDLQKNDPAYSQLKDFTQNAKEYIKNLVNDAIENNEFTFKLEDVQDVISQKSYDEAKDYEAEYKKFVKDNEQVLEDVDEYKPLSKADYLKQYEKNLIEQGMTKAEAKETMDEIGKHGKDTIYSNYLNRIEQAKEEFVMRQYFELNGFSKPNPTVEQDFRLENLKVDNVMAKNNSKLSDFEKMLEQPDIFSPQADDLVEEMNKTLGKVANEIKEEKKVEAKPEEKKINEDLPDFGEDEIEVVDRDSISSVASTIEQISVDVDDNIEFTDDQTVEEEAKKIKKDVLSI